LLEGRDTLALLPTGGGKSLCFQVPALCKEGVCIVVSPLIALMKDQVETLHSKGIAAEAIYSGMAYRQIDRILDNCVFGNVKLLYLSPERLTTHLVRERIKRMKVSFLAIDEAHCVSQWGYDFRPPYLKIPEIRDILPKNTPVLALTATAIPEVVEDIQQQLRFGKNAQVFQQSFQRKNLAYVVLPEENKLTKLLDILKKVPGTGIVYTRNRKKTKDIALFLQKNHISADFYHAGLTPDERGKKQDAWKTNQTRVIVSTNAFGMGIDKPDVRTVVHVDMPDSLEAYFQEAGRAGRDGQKAYSILLYAPEDKFNLELTHTFSFPSMEEMRKVYQALGSYCSLAVGGGQGESFDFDLLEFIKTFQLDAAKTHHCLKTLEQTGWISVSEAVFIASQIQFLASKEALYAHQIRHKNSDLLIKTLLRVTIGSFQHFCDINEFQLAKYMKITADMVKSALKVLQSEGIIDYIEQKNTPQITFLRERVATENMTIDIRLYNFRKERHLQQIRSTINYAETPRCRSQQLVSYFGEKNNLPCAVCDVCTGRTQSDLTMEEYDTFKKKIYMVLKGDDLPATEIVKAFHARHENKIIRTLENLLDEGAIEKKHGLFFLQKK
jgi:ATP-dependent DNA helicase RecQ